MNENDTVNNYKLYRDEVEELYANNKEDFINLLTYYHEFNGHTNISAIRDDDGIINKHFKDSLQAVSLIAKYKDTKFKSNFKTKQERESSEKGIKIIDLGTGGGFPAIPLALTLHDCNIIALDSVAKKLRFIEEIKESFNLANLASIAARAEELARAEAAREKFEFVVSRAVAYLPQLLELAAGFIRPKGYLLAFKQAEDEGAELAAASKAFHALRFKHIETKKYANGRQIFVFQKTHELAFKYPRDYSRIKSKPL